MLVQIEYSDIVKLRERLKAAQDFNKVFYEVQIDHVREMNLNIQAAINKIDGIIAKDVEMYEKELDEQARGYGEPSISELIKERYAGGK